MTWRRPPTVLLVAALLPRVSHESGHHGAHSGHRGAHSVRQRPIHHERAFGPADRCVQESSDGIVSQPKRCGCGSSRMFRGAWTRPRSQSTFSGGDLQWQLRGCDLSQFDSAGEDYIQPDVSQPVSCSHVVLRGRPGAVVSTPVSHVPSCKSSALLRLPKNTTACVRFVNRLLLHRLTSSRMRTRSSHISLLRPCLRVFSISSTDLWVLRALVPFFRNIEPSSKCTSHSLWTQCVWCET